MRQPGAQADLWNNTFADAGMEIAVSSQCCGRVVQVDDWQTAQADHAINVCNNPFYLLNFAEIVASPPEVGSIETDAQPLGVFRQEGQHGSQVLDPIADFVTSAHIVLQQD